jgi:elongation factor Ts
MAAIDAKLVKELREVSGAGVLDCKKALEETGGNVDEALKWLRERGIKVAAKKASREAKEGQVAAYIHQGGRIGVLVEVNCETDFVARTDEYQLFCRQVAMQIAASSPEVVKKEDLSSDAIEAEKEIYRSQLRDSGKPANIIDKIVDGKIDKYCEEVCLLEQEWIHNPETGRVRDALTALISKTGENIVIKRFSRFQIGS